MPSELLCQIKNLTIYWDTTLSKYVLRLLDPQIGYSFIVPIDNVNAFYEAAKKMAEDKARIS